MARTELTRLTITWSKNTDLALRSYVAAQRLKKGALSKFVEDAVKWRLFGHTVNEVRDAFADLRANHLNNIIDEAVASVRNRPEHKTRSRK